MSLIIAADYFERETPKELSVYASRYQRDPFNSVEVSDRFLTIEVLSFLLETAKDLGKSKDARTFSALLQAREGEVVRVPNFQPFAALLKAHLLNHKIDGWLYEQRRDGNFYPILVTDIRMDQGRSSQRGPDDPSVTLRGRVFSKSSNSSRGSLCAESWSVTFNPGDVARRHITDILKDKNLFTETQELKDAYEVSMDRYRQDIREQFSEQFRFSGIPVAYEKTDYGRGINELDNRKVIHDIPVKEHNSTVLFDDSILFEDAEDGQGTLPVHPLVRVFDAKTHEYFWVHSDNLTPYTYDKSLRDKLVLPDHHRDLLDVLTSDINDYVEDIIEGKSAGNIIMCKGHWGVGKTLTAEVYAELIERPLLAVHSGQLGTSASSIEKSLKGVFDQAKRWNAVLLLDEADVFVSKREHNVEANAIVAEFLRSMEYFDGLMFMTTNRPNDIDEAILSRCAAIIDYSLPDKEHLTKIWGVMNDQFKAGLSPGVIESLVDKYPNISPRDVKHLLRLAIRVSEKMAEPLDMEMFRRCAMFRALDAEV